jgi:CubicO group peptidase (beta-lactamase class C family)
VAGTCDPGFRSVQEEAFEENLAAGLEAGAACAVVVDGHCVVDLWGGICDAEGQPWERDTLVDCRSATKGLTALCLAILVDRGLVDVDASLRDYWPELRINPTVRHALSHQAGIPVIDDVPRAAILDWDVMAAAVARQEPMWSPVNGMDTTVSPSAGS